MIITVTSFAAQAGILPVFVAWLTLQAFWFDNLECRKFSLLNRNPIYIRPVRCRYLHLTRYLTRSLMLKLIVLTQMIVTKAANKYSSTVVPNTSFAFYTHGSLKILLEYGWISGMSYLYYHKSVLPFLLFTCNAQEQAWEAKHLRPWQTHASQKSQIAPTIAIPNEYETVCENPDHMKTLEI